jgi:hypothetical protein
VKQLSSKEYVLFNLENIISFEIEYSILYYNHVMWNVSCTKLHVKRPMV